MTKKESINELLALKKESTEKALKAVARFFKKDPIQVTEKVLMSAKYQGITGTNQRLDPALAPLTGERRKSESKAEMSFDRRVNRIFKKL